SEGSSGSVRKPRSITRSRSGWKRVPSAHSICSSEKTSMSGSTTSTFLTFATEPNAAMMALRASPGTRWRTAMRTVMVPPVAAGAGDGGGPGGGGRGRARHHPVVARAGGGGGVVAALGGAAEGEGLKRRVGGGGERGNGEVGVVLAPAVIAEELAVGSFRL